MNGGQPSAQPCSANPVDTTRHNNSMIVNESIRAAHNDGIIVGASTSIWQEEMNGDQPSTQPKSANPIVTRRNNDGMIVNESISVQQEESIVEIVATMSILPNSKWCYFFEGICALYQTGPCSSVHYVCVSSLRLRLGYCKCMRYQSLVPSR
jgi:hypothetical protein